MGTEHVFLDPLVGDVEFIGGTPCAYCSHPRVHHHAGRCYTERRGVGGVWQNCTCTQYVEQGEAA